MERTQTQSAPRTFPAKLTWQRKPPNHEQRPPHQLDAANMVEQYNPFCRACKDLHEESSCYYGCYVQEHGFPEGCGPKASSSKLEYINYVDDMHDISGESWRETKQYSREPEYINAVGQLHPVTTETRGQVEDYSQQLDDLTKNFGTNPTNEHNDDSLEGLLPCDLFF